jgi:hypothetical protein
MQEAPSRKIPKGSEAFEIAQRHLAAMLVEQLGSDAVPLLEAVSSCGGGHLDDEAAQLLSKCQGLIIFYP